MECTRWPWTRRERELYRLGAKMVDAFAQLDAERVSYEALAIALVRPRRIRGLRKTRVAS